jgi:hypothetical protein
MTLFELLSNLFSSRRDRGSTRLAIEPLEGRLVPATLPLLNPGQVLHPGDSVRSPNSQFHLLLRTDGDLVETGPYGDKLWESYTGGRGVLYATLQTDGNFVLYGPPHADGSLNPIKGFGTERHPGDVLRVQDDGNVVIYQFDHPLWATNTVGRDANLYLRPGQSIYPGAVRFTLQTDGNLVVYGSFGQVFFSSRTDRRPVIEAILQTDGNLVLYGPNNADGSAHPIWASNTAGHYGATYTAAWDGLLIYDRSGHRIWDNGDPVP